MEIKLQTGAELKALIESIGLNQHQFSKILGTNRSAISLWVNGKRSIPNDVREHALLINWAVKTQGIDPKELPQIIRCNHLLSL